MRIDPIEFLTRALAYEGRPYFWGRDGPDAFDCSGLIACTLLECGGPDWRSTHTAQRLFDVLPRVEAKDAQPGDLVFYGPPHRITHVMIVATQGRVYGACGGDSSTTTLELAKARGAGVRFRKAVAYRRDVRGFRRLEVHQ
jgi:murein DD-endopeptidase